MSAEHSPEHSPLQLPSHLAPACTSHSPSHLPEHSPLTLPPSHSTLAEPGFTVASHLAAQSATTLIDAEQRGGFTSTLSEPLALAFASPTNFTAALHAASAFLPGPSSFGL